MTPKNSHLNSLLECDKLNLYQPPKPKFVPVVIDGKLIFKFDRERGLIEWQHRGEKHIIDLSSIN